MSDDNINYYKPSSGSLVGFDQANIPADTPNLAKTGWSVEQLRSFLLNQSDVSFPSAEFILRVQDMITAHETDYNNPHRTSLDQIVGDFVTQALGSITPGTVPSIPPFYSIDAQLGLPLGTLVAALYSSSNLYRQSAGGALIDIATDPLVVAADYVGGAAGIPLFSKLTNIGVANWSTVSGALLNTTTTTLVAPALNYPFGFKVINENPVTGQFGINLVMNQELGVTYTSAFFLYDVGTGGTVRVFQPSQPTVYVDIDLTTGTAISSSAQIHARTERRADGVIHGWVSFTASTTVADDSLRLVHINAGSSGDGTRAGSNGRQLFALAQPQTTESNVGYPCLVDLATPGSISALSLKLDRVGAPATLSHVTVTMTLDMYPELSAATVSDGTILLFDDLVITRDQTTIRVSVAGNPICSSSILNGLNVITVSYSPTQIVFKDLHDARQTINGTFPSLATGTVTVGPCGGYLRNLAMYAEADTLQLVEFLTNA